MSVITGKDKNGISYSIIIRENGLVSCISDHIMQHRFIGLVRDVQTAVDLHLNKRVVLQEEEDNFDECITSLVKDRSMLSITNILHQQSYHIYTLTTSWIYTDPVVDIVNKRHVYYVIFEVTSHPFNKVEMMTDLMSRMSVLVTHHP